MWGVTSGQGAALNTTKHASHFFSWRRTVYYTYLLAVCLSTKLSVCLSFS